MSSTFNKKSDNRRRDPRSVLDVVRFPDTASVSSHRGGSGGSTWALGNLNAVLAHALLAHALLAHALLAHALLVSKELLGPCRSEGSLARGEERARAMTTARHARRPRIQAPSRARLAGRDALATSLGESPKRRAWSLHAALERSREFSHPVTAMDAPAFRCQRIAMVSMSRPTSRSGASPTTSGATSIQPGWQRLQAVSDRCAISEVVIDACRRSSIAAYSSSWPSTRKLRGPLRPARPRYRRAFASATRRS
jgi:hypothetical protein